MEARLRKQLYWQWIRESRSRSDEINGMQERTGQVMEETKDGRHSQAEPRRGRAS